jgi:phage shock protein PspC (stress-responsive transcriptional regulator)
MSLSDELERLKALRDGGTLTDEEFARAKARVLEGQAAGGGPAPAGIALNRLRRSRSDRWIGGVCGGIAALSGVDSWIWRLILVAFALFGGVGLVIYLLLWIFVPEE